MCGMSAFQVVGKSLGTLRSCRAFTDEHVLERARLSIVPSAVKLTLIKIRLCPKDPNRLDSCRTVLMVRPGTLSGVVANPLVPIRNCKQAPPSEHDRITSIIGFQPRLTTLWPPQLNLTICCTSTRGYVAPLQDLYSDSLPIYSRN